MKTALIHRTTLEIEASDIVSESTDAIVNPAQRSLQPGCGVDGHIHQWGGLQIQRECSEIGGCATGDAVITTAGELEAQWVIHTVGPIWSGGMAGEPELLASCYRRCLDIAIENSIESIAFPAISCGDYGYPIGLATPIALATVGQYVRATEGLLLVRFVVKGRRALEAYEAAWENMEDEFRF